MYDADDSEYLTDSGSLSDDCCDEGMKEVSEVSCAEYASGLRLTLSDCLGLFVTQAREADTLNHRSLDSESSSLASRIAKNNCSALYMIANMLIDKLVMLQPFLDVSQLHSTMEFDAVCIMYIVTTISWDTTLDDGCAFLRDAILPSDTTILDLEFARVIICARSIAWDVEANHAQLNILHSILIHHPTSWTGCDMVGCEARLSEAQEHLDDLV